MKNHRVAASLIVVAFVMMNCTILKADIGMTPDGTQVVKFEDKRLDEIIREQVGKPDGDILVEDLDGITKICDLDGSITSLDGIQYCKDLKHLETGGNHITNLSPLSNLTQLEYLYLGKSYINDISCLKNLTKLKGLEISATELSDISSISGMMGLEWLAISDSKVKDIKPLQYLTNLKQLYLASNNISDISYLANCKELVNLDLSFNNINDISALANLTKIKSLNIGYNGKISNIEPLKECKELVKLVANSNKIVDLTPLSSLSNVTEIDLTKNFITNIDAIGKCNNLTSLSLGSNEITNIDKLSGCKYLTTLYLDDNKIKNISVIKDLGTVNRLLINCNNIQDLSPIYNRKFKELGIKFNDITDISEIGKLDLSNIDGGFLGNFIDMNIAYNSNVQSYLDYYGIEVGTQHQLGLTPAWLIKPNGDEEYKGVLDGPIDLNDTLRINAYFKQGDSLGYISLNDGETVNYYSNDASIATVDKNGVIKGIKDGKTKIWGVYKGIDSSYTKDYIEVEFKQASSPVTPPVVDPPVTPPVIDPPVNPPVTPPKNTDSGGGIQEVVKNTHGTILGRVLNKNTPVENVEVTLIGSNSRDVTYTDKDGKYEFKDVVFGQYTIMIRKDGKYLVKIIVVR